MIFSVFHWYIRLRHWHVGSLMIDLIALLSTLTLILSWLLWSLHMHTLTPVYRLAWYVDSFACIVSWSSLGMTFVSLSIWLSYSCLPCVYMMIYLRFVWLCGAWLPSSAWLYASCLCGSHIYPLISHSLVSVISFILVLAFASVRPCVCACTLTEIEVRSRV